MILSLLKYTTLSVYAKYLDICYERVSIMTIILALSISIFEAYVTLLALVRRFLDSRIRLEYSSTNNRCIYL